MNVPTPPDTPSASASRGLPVDGFDLEILACEESPVGTICLQRRTSRAEPGVTATEIALDQELLMSSLVTASERALAATALELHPAVELDVLIGGLGLGYTAREALGLPRVRRVEVVEYLPPVIEWMKRGLVPLSGELRADPRLVVARGDVYARLAAEPEGAFDLILIDVDHSPEERLGSASDAFYTPGGLMRARRHLRPGGVLGVWSYAESPGFERLLRGVFDDVHVETASFVHPFFGDEETNWLYFGRA